MSNIAVSIITSIVSGYTILILAAILLSWVRPSVKVFARVREFVDSMTNPYLRFFRRFVPPLGRLDFSPLVALLTLQVVGGAAAAAASGL
jgi:YggT family protein